MQALQKMILVTAFEPFGDDALNPTEMLLERLPERLGGCEIRTLLLPVEFVRARERAFAAYDELRPGAVVMLGQAGGRSAITPESTGKNVMNGKNRKKRSAPISNITPEILISSRLSQATPKTLTRPRGNSV